MASIVDGPQDHCGHCEELEDRLARLEDALTTTNTTLERGLLALNRATAANTRTLEIMVQPARPTPASHHPGWLRRIFR